MIDPLFVRRQIENLKLMHPEIWEDEDHQVLLDALEGETSLHEFLGALVDRKDKIEERLPGLEKRISDHRARKERYEGQVAMLRALALKLMDAAGVRRVELDQATLSIRVGQPKVIITDETLLPEHCTRTKVEPDKIAIKAILTSGVPVSGAELSNAEPVLNVRPR